MQFLLPCSVTSLHIDRVYSIRRVAKISPLFAIIPIVSFVRLFSMGVVRFPAIVIQPLIVMGFTSGNLNRTCCFITESAWCLGH